MHPHQRNESGAALVMALLLVVVVGALTASITDGNRRLAADTIDERAAVQAMQAAEGGIEHARHRLRRDPNFRAETFSVGTAEVEVVVQAVRGQELRWTVRSTARCWPRGDLGLCVQRRLAAELVGRSGLPAISSWRELR